MREVIIGERLVHEISEFLFEDENDAEAKAKELTNEENVYVVVQQNVVPKKPNPLIFAPTASYDCNFNFTSSYALTASYNCFAGVPTILTPPSKKSEFEEYFISLGYKVSYDWNRAGEKWWELYDNGLVAQIDMGVPLKDILMDLCQIHLGKPGVSKSDYKVCGNGPKFDEMLKRVYEKENT